MAFYRSHVLVCVEPECLAKGAHEVVDALQDELIAHSRRTDDHTNKRT